MCSKLASMAAGLVMAASPLSTSGHAQTYPSQPITFVVPNLPGGSSDLIARAVAKSLQKNLGQPVVVENKPGASEMIATELLARAAPDGYTMAILSSALSINETLSPGRRYDTRRDLIPVAKLAELPFALIVTSTLPVTTLKEFVAHAKANPGRLSYGHVGVGAPHYLTMEWFKREAGIDLLAVPYRSSPPVYAGLMGGEIQVTVAALGGATQFIEECPLAGLPPSRTCPRSPNPVTTSSIWSGGWVCSSRQERRPMSFANSKRKFFRPSRAAKSASNSSASVWNLLRRVLLNSVHWSVATSETGRKSSRTLA